jgi:ABC-2 type transport system permease protein
MTLFKRDFKNNLKGLIIWGASIILLLLLMLQQFKSTGSAMDVGSYSDSFKKAMGMDKIDVNTLIGYYSIKASVLVTLFGSIYAAILSSSIIVKDEFLLSKPIDRINIIVEKLFVVTVNILLLNAAVALVLAVFDTDKAIVSICLSQFILHMVFGASGFLLSVIKIKSKSVLSAPLGIVLATYTISLIYSLPDKLDGLKYLSPFYYMNSQDIISKGSISIFNILITSAIIVICTFLSIIIYKRRDLPA